MYQYIHIDEKWFYMTKEAEKYYLLPDEEDPQRYCQSKRFVSKVMFMTATARPRFDMLRNHDFCGKIGIFPFISKELLNEVAKIALRAHWRQSQYYQ